MSANADNDARARADAARNEKRRNAAADKKKKVAIAPAAAAAPAAGVLEDVAEQPNDHKQPPPPPPPQQQPQPQPKPPVNKFAKGLRHVIMGLSNAIDVPARTNNNNNDNSNNKLGTDDDAAPTSPTCKVCKTKQSSFVHADGAINHDEVFVHLLSDECTMMAALRRHKQRPISDIMDTAATTPQGREVFLLPLPRLMNPTRMPTKAQINFAVGVDDSEPAKPNPTYGYLATLFSSFAADGSKLPTSTMRCLCCNSNATNPARITYPSTHAISLHVPKCALIMNPLRSLVAHPAVQPSDNSIVQRAKQSAAAAVAAQQPLPTAQRKITVEQVEYVLRVRGMFTNNIEQLALLDQSGRLDMIRFRWTVAGSQFGGFEESDDDEEDTGKIDESRVYIRAMFSEAAKPQVAAAAAAPLVINDDDDDIPLVALANRAAAAAATAAAATASASTNKQSYTCLLCSSTITAIGIATISFLDHARHCDASTLLLAAFLNHPTAVTAADNQPGIADLKTALRKQRVPSFVPFRHITSQQVEFLLRVKGLFDPLNVKQQQQLADAGLKLTSEMPDVVKCLYVPMSALPGLIDAGRRAEVERRQELEQQTGLAAQHTGGSKDRATYITGDAFRAKKRAEMDFVRGQLVNSPALVAAMQDTAREIATQQVAAVRLDGTLPPSQAMRSAIAENALFALCTQCLLELRPAEQIHILRLDTIRSDDVRGGHHNRHGAAAGHQTGQPFSAASSTGFGGAGHGHGGAMLDAFFRGNRAEALQLQDAGWLQAQEQRAVQAAAATIRRLITAPPLKPPREHCECFSAMAGREPVAAGNRLSNGIRPVPVLETVRIDKLTLVKLADGRTVKFNPIAATHAAEHSLHAPIHVPLDFTNNSSFAARLLDVVSELILSMHEHISGDYREWLVEKFGQTALCNFGDRLRVTIPVTADFARKNGKRDNNSSNDVATSNNNNADIEQKDSDQEDEAPFEADISDELVEDLDEDAGDDDEQQCDALRSRINRNEIAVFALAHFACSEGLPEEAEDVVYTAISVVEDLLNVAWKTFDGGAFALPRFLAQKLARGNDRRGHRCRTLYLVLRKPDPDNRNDLELQSVSHLHPPSLGQLNGLVTQRTVCRARPQDQFVLFTDRDNNGSNRSEILREQTNNNVVFLDGFVNNQLPCAATLVASVRLVVVPLFEQLPLMQLKQLFDRVKFGITGILDKRFRGGAWQSGVLSRDSLQNLSEIGADGGLQRSPTYRQLVDEGAGVFIPMFTFRSGYSRVARMAVQLSERLLNYFGFTADGGSSIAATVGSTSPQHLYFFASTSAPSDDTARTAVNTGKLLMRIVSAQRRAQSVPVVALLPHEMRSEVVCRPGLVQPRRPRDSAGAVQHGDVVSACSVAPTWLRAVDRDGSVIYLCVGAAPQQDVNRFLRDITSCTIVHDEDPVPDPYPCRIPSITLRAGDSAGVAAGVAAVGWQRSCIIEDVDMNGCQLPYFGPVQHSLAAPQPAAAVDVAAPANPHWSVCSHWPAGGQWLSHAAIKEADPLPATQPATPTNNSSPPTKPDGSLPTPQEQRQGWYFYPPSSLNKIPLRTPQHHVRTLLFNRAVQPAVVQHPARRRVKVLWHILTPCANAARQVQVLAEMCSPSALPPASFAPPCLVASVSRDVHMPFAVNIGVGGVANAPLFMAQSWGEFGTAQPHTKQEMLNWLRRA